MNENCLLGFQCPTCGSYGPFFIEIKVVMLVDDDGTDLISNEGFDWEDESYCKCYSCQHPGTVKDFKLEKTND